MFDNPELRIMLVDLWADLHDVKILWQLAAVAASLCVAWVISRALRSRIEGVDRTASFGRHTLAAIQFPLFALILVLISRVILGSKGLTLLNITVALLTAAVIIRIAVVMLRQVFAPSGWLNKMIKLVAWTVWIGFALHISGLAPDLLKFLDDIAITFGKHRISLLLVMQAVLSVLITLLVALWLGRFIEARAMAATDFNINLRVMISKLAQALLVILAILIALPAVGIDPTALSVFGGALGVGIGLGLQKIASNYVSGFLILMDRSVSPGDLVTIDNHTGLLTKMTARYVVVRSLAGVEAIIPNDTLMTSTVINRSYSDRRVRQTVLVQVGYDSDVELALRTLEEVAARQPRTLADPAPKAMVTKFADSGIELELGLWIEDAHTGAGNLRSDLYLEIWREFHNLRIEIPYPRREVQITHQNAPSENEENINKNK